MEPSSSSLSSTHHLTQTPNRPTAPISICQSSISEILEPDFYKQHQLTPTQLTASSSSSSASSVCSSPHVSRCGSPITSASIDSSNSSLLNLNSDDRPALARHSHSSDCKDCSLMHTPADILPAASSSSYDSATTPMGNRDTNPFDQARPLDEADLLAQQIESSGILADDLKFESDPVPPPILSQALAWSFKNKSFLAAAASAEKSQLSSLPLLDMQSFSNRSTPIAAHLSLPPPRLPPPFLLAKSATTDGYMNKPKRSDPDVWNTTPDPMICSLNMNSPVKSSSASSTQSGSPSFSSCFAPPLTRTSSMNNRDDLELPASPCSSKSSCSVSFPMSPVGSIAPFLDSRPAPIGAELIVEALDHQYILSIKLPGFSLDCITLAARKHRVLHIVADDWATDKGGHFERRVTFGVDADMNTIRAAFDGDHLVITVPRKISHRISQQGMPTTLADEWQKSQRERDLAKRRVSPPIWSHLGWKSKDTAS